MFFDSEEELVMDYHTEEVRTHSTNFHFKNDAASECSTLSASEGNSSGRDSTPPLFYKLKKARVMIKKLPKKVLAKYKMGGDTTSLRSSGRLRSKHIPAGQYKALAMNKPLHEVLKPKNKQTLNHSNIVENVKPDHQRRHTILPVTSSTTRQIKTHNVSADSGFKSKYVAASNRSYSIKTQNVPPDTGFKSKDVAPSNRSYSLQSHAHLVNKPGLTISRNEYKNKATSLANRANVGKSTAITSKDSCSLQERISMTGIQNSPKITLPPMLPEVIISGNEAPSSINNFVVNGTLAVKTVSRNTMQNGKPPIVPVPRLYSSPNVQSKVIPALLAPTPTNNDLQRPSLPQRKFTIQAFKIPDDPSISKDPIPVTTPKVFVVNQSLVGNGALNMPDSPARLIDKENATANSTSISVDSASDLEPIDTEKHIEPEVIKRIVYHTKAVQTKFTCNSSICGIVNADDFNLNCFYCYDIFPLHKWFEFKEHIKVVHQIEERANLSDSDTESDDADTQNQLNNCSNKISHLPNENGERSFTTKAVNTTEQVYKKLPLEPRLLAQRENRMIQEPLKLVTSTPKPVRPLQIIDQSTKSVTCNNTTQINETICLDSDEGDQVIEGFDGQNKKTAERRPLLFTNKKPQSDNKAVQSNVRKLVLPSLPQITIKKVANVAPNMNVETCKAPSNTMPSIKENFIKSPLTTNIQNVTETLPHPTESQLTAKAETRPRYFVVKKIIKFADTNAANSLKATNPSDFHIRKGTILKKMPQPSTSIGITNTGEDSVPKPTSGLGILFGLTNSKVVIEFLLKLKTYPELWHSQLKNNNPIKYNESIKKFCFHLNNRFNLQMTEYEMLLSIQRVKDWYSLMLQTIHEHNNKPNNTEPYKHRFPEYFEILSQYLPLDVDQKSVSKITLTAKINDAKLNKSCPVANETQTQSTVENTSTTKPSIASPGKECSENQDASADSLIEFDADTLYDQESSDEEPLVEFVSTSPAKNVTKKNIFKVDGTPRKLTKVYTGKFECDVCHRCFKRECDLRRHRAFHFPPPFECGRCSQKFYFKYMAERCAHVKSSERRPEKRKYTKRERKSTVCFTPDGKRIWPKKIFTSHMICEICGNIYRSIGSLNTHKKDKHFNNRNKCVVCNFTALSEWLVRRHQRKRHIVEPGLPEDVARKCRARPDTKVTFSNEVRQAWLWRREMRKHVKPGEKFYGCGKCKIVFDTRKEKVLHNKTEHPITEDTVVCLLCLPTILLLVNPNGARRHYVDIHKVAWHEIDGLVMATRPLYKLLSKEEIELLRASENYKELLVELLKDKKLKPPENIDTLADETSEAVENLPNIKELEGENRKTEVTECITENVYVDGTTDQVNYGESNDQLAGYASVNEHDYSEEQVINESFNELEVVVDNSRDDEPHAQQPCDEEETVHINTDTDGNDFNMGTYIQNDQGYSQTIVGDFVDGELVEESLIVEEYIDEIIGEEQMDFV